MSDIKEFKKYMIDLNVDDSLVQFIIDMLEGETDYQSIIVKFEILHHEGIDINAIQEELMENPFFVICDPKVVETNLEVLKKYVEPEEISKVIEMNVDYLTIEENHFEQNIKMLKVILPEASFNLLLKGHGEILTFNSDYLEKRLEFFIKNGFKDRLEEFIIGRIDLFDMDEDEINFDELI